MSQYFILANLSKKEYLKFAMKLWEWCANNVARLIPWLLAKGPQDGTTLCYFDPDVKNARDTYIFSNDKNEKEKAIKIISKSAETPIGKGYFKTCGRWAGDKIVLIGDYDKSGLYDVVVTTFKDITKEVVNEFNEFIEDNQLKVYML